MEYYNGKYSGKRTIKDAKNEKLKFATIYVKKIQIENLGHKNFNPF